jgi:hypothetical protein
MFPPSVMQITVDFFRGLPAHEDDLDHPARLL